MKLYANFIKSKNTAALLPTKRHCMYVIEAPLLAPPPCLLRSQTRWKVLPGKRNSRRERAKPPCCRVARLSPCFIHTFIFEFPSGSQMQLEEWKIRTLRMAPSSRQNVERFRGDRIFPLNLPKFLLPISPKFAQISKKFPDFLIFKPSFGGLIQRGGRFTPTKRAHPLPPDCSSVTTLASSFRRPL